MVMSMELLMARARLNHTGASQTVDDFSVAGTINNYTITEQGTATGSGAQTGGNLVLTPAANAGDSVAARRAGPWSGVKVQASLATLTSGGSPKYFDISIGSGTIVPMNGGSAWWHTTLSDGYMLEWNNGVHVFVLQKMIGGANTTLVNYDMNFADSGAGSHSYELRYNKTTQNVECVLDGTVVMTYNDQNFAGGDALIAQGAYTNGDGCIASVSTVTLTQ